MSMGHREVIKSGAEVDAIQAKDSIRHRPGVRAYAKAQINRRARHEATEALRVMIGWKASQYLAEESES